MKGSYQKIRPCWFSLQGFLALLLVLVTGSDVMGFAGGTYTIDRTSAASATNYQSFTAFVQDLQGIARSDGGAANYSIGGAGVQGNIVVNVAVGSGPYTEQVLIPAITGMTGLTRTVTINGNNETLQFSPTATDVYVLRLSGADYFRFNKLKIVGTNATYGWGVHLYNSSDYNIFDGCEIDLTAITSTTASNSVGFALNSNTTALQQQNGANGQRNVIQNCYIHGGAAGGPYHGVVFCGTSNTLYYNKFINNRIEDFYAYGFHCSAIGGALFKNNKISRPKRTAGTTLYGWYTINNNNPSDTFDGNWITNMFGGMSTSTVACYGIAWATPNVPVATPCYVYNNVFANWGGLGQRLAFSQTYGANIHYYHNTISFDDNVSTSSAQIYYGLYVQLAFANDRVDFKNNIVSMLKPTSNSAIAYSNASANMVAAQDYNVYNMRASVANAYVVNDINFSGGPWTALSAWQTASSRDMNSKQVNPAFADLTNLDLSPTTSAVIAMAPAIATVKTDVNGNARGSSVNPGAFELLTDIAIKKATLDNASVCNLGTSGLVAKIKNEGPKNSTNMIVGYSVNGVHQYWDTVKSTLVVGDSINFRFKKDPKFIVRGINTVRVYPMIKDPNSANDIAVTTINVLGTPTGSTFSYGVIEKGIPALGTLQAPDIIFPNDTFEIDMTPPTGFVGSTYGTGWTMQVTVLNGATVVNPPNYEYIPFTATKNAKLRFLVDPSLENKDLRIVLNVKETSVNNCDTTLNRYIHVGPKPHPSIGVIAPTFCDGDKIIFSSTSKVSSGVMDLKWDFGDGETEGNNPGPEHIYKKAGTYTVRLTTTTVPYGYVLDTTVKVVISERPVANFSVVNACEGLPVKFTNRSTLSSGTPTYEWDFGDGSPVSTTVNPSKLYAVAGRYTVMLTASSNGCKAVISKNAYEFVKPKAAFNILPGDNCENKAVKFQNTSTIASGEYGVIWNYNDNNNIATDLNPEYRFSGPGLKTIKLLAVSEFGCADSVTQTLTIKPAPKSSFTNTPACNETPTVFTNSSILPPGSTPVYTWSFGDGSPTTQQPSPSHDWSVPGKKTVTLKTAINNGCTDEFVKVLTVGFQPKADFDAADQCADKFVEFQNFTTWENGSISYEWNFGDGNFDDAAAPIHKYNSSGISQTYNVKLVATISGGCQDSIVKTVTISPVPTTCDFDIVYDGTTGHRNYRFVPKGGSPANINYHWLTGDGSNKSSVSAGTNYNYKADGKYTVKMTARNPNGCECTQSKVVNINFTGVEDIGDMGTAVNVYPNPNNGTFNVVIGEDLKITKANVYNLLGELVKTQPVNSSNFEVDMSGYASGVYLLKLYNGNSVITKKVTINR